MKRFQLMLENPANKFETEFKAAADLLIQEECWEEMEKMKNYFNNLEDKEYSWHIERHNQMESLDDCLERLHVIVGILFNRAKEQVTDESVSAGIDGVGLLVHMAAPWMPIMDMANKQCQWAFTNLVISDCKIVQKKLKIFFDDNVEIKRKAIDEGVQVMNRLFIKVFQGKPVEQYKLVLKNDKYEIEECKKTTSNENSNA